MAVKLSNPGTIYVKNIQKAMLNSSKCILSGKLIVYQSEINVVILSPHL